LNGEEVIRDRLADEPPSDWLDSYVKSLDNAIKMGEYEDFLNPKTDIKINNKSDYTLLEENEFYEIELH